MRAHLLDALFSKCAAPRHQAKAGQRSRWAESKSATDLPSRTLRDRGTKLKRVNGAGSKSATDLPSHAKTYTLYSPRAYMCSMWARVFSYLSF
jgi:hypothetical protein